MSIFTNEIEIYKDQVYKRRLVQFFVGGCAVVTMTSALINSQKPKNILLTELGLSSLFGFGAAYIAKVREELEQKYLSLIEMDKQHLKTTWSHEFANQQTAKEVLGELEIAAFLRELPAYAQARYADKYQLHGLINLQPLKSAQPPVNESMSVSVITNQINELSIREKSDLHEWYTEDFTYQSCIFAGRKGSGKSYFLKHKASRAKELFPDAQIVIIDPAYDPDDVDEDWFIGIPYENKKAIIADNRDDIWKMIQAIYAEMRDRIDNKIKNRVPLLIFLDELENVINGFSSDAQKDLFIDTINTIQNECRKYKIQINLGCHTLKKEMIGIDSTILSQMNQVIAQNIAFDSNTRFPSNFDKKAIEADVKALIVDPSKGKGVIVLDSELGTYRVTILPLLPKITFDGVVSDNITDTSDEPVKDDHTHYRSGSSMEEIQPSPTDAKRELLDQLFNTLVIWFVECIIAEMDITDDDIAEQWEIVSNIRYDNPDAVKVLASKVRESAKNITGNS